MSDILQCMDVSQLEVAGSNTPGALSILIRGSYLSSTLGITSRLNLFPPRLSNHAMRNKAYSAYESSVLCPIHTSFFDKFLRIRKKRFTETDNFISSWYALAGRSTTKAEGLYVVLASCLDFKLCQLRSFPTSAEKMQRMIFSFQELPFPLFSTMGPDWTRREITETDGCLQRSVDISLCPDPRSCCLTHAYPNIPTRGPVSK